VYLLDHVSLDGTVLRLGVNDAVEVVVGLCVHFVINVLFLLYHKSPISKSELIMFIQSVENLLLKNDHVIGVQKFAPSYQILNLMYHSYKDPREQYHKEFKIHC